jgi:hypothetical protein
MRERSDRLGVRQRSLRSCRLQEGEGRMAAPWSFYICFAIFSALRRPLPSPLWGRGWTAPRRFLQPGRAG